MKGGKLSWTPDAVKRFKERVREITARTNGRNMPSRINVLRRYVTGWLNYFGHSRTYQAMDDLDHWLRRRVCMCFWKTWKHHVLEGDICWPWAYRAIRLNWPREAVRETGGCPIT